MCMPKVCISCSHSRGKRATSTCPCSHGMLHHLWAHGPEFNSCHGNGHNGMHALGTHSQTMCSDGMIRHGSSSRSIPAVGIISWSACTPVRCVLWSYSLWAYTPVQTYAGASLLIGLANGNPQKGIVRVAIPDMLFWMKAKRMLSLRCGSDV